MSRQLTEAQAWRELATQFRTTAHHWGICPAISSCGAGARARRRMYIRTHRLGQQRCIRHRHDGRNLGAFGWPVVVGAPDPARVAYCLRQARRCDRERRAARRERS